MEIDGICPTSSTLTISTTDIGAASESTRDVQINPPDVKRQADLIQSTHVQASQSDLKAAEVVERPRVNRASLIVTAELDIAISRCKKKVLKLARGCRRANRRYRLVMNSRMVPR